MGSMLRLHCLAAFLLFYAEVEGSVITTTTTITPEQPRTNSTKLQNTSEDISQYGPTLQSYRDFPAGTGVGSWQEIAMYPSKDNRNGRNLVETTAAGLSSACSTWHSNSLTFLLMLMCLTYHR